MITRHRARGERHREAQLAAGSWQQAAGSWQRTEDRTSSVGAALPDLSLSKVSSDLAVSMTLRTKCQM